MSTPTNEEILFNAVKELTIELKEQRKENKRIKSLTSIPFNNDTNDNIDD